MKYKKNDKNIQWLTMNYNVTHHCYTVIQLYSIQYTLYSIQTEEHIQTLPKTWGPGGPGDHRHTTNHTISHHSPVRGLNIMCHPTLLLVFFAFLNIRSFSKMRPSNLPLNDLVMWVFVCVCFLSVICVIVIFIYFPWANIKPLIQQSWG